MLKRENLLIKFHRLGERFVNPTFFYYSHYPTKKKVMIIQDVQILSTDLDKLDN